MVKLRLIDFVMKICVCLPYLNLQIFNTTVEYMFRFSTRKKKTSFYRHCVCTGAQKGQTGLALTLTEAEARAVQVVATCSVTSRWH